MKWRAGGWETAIRVYSRRCRKQVPNGFVKLDPTHGCGMLLRTGGPREADFCCVGACRILVKLLTAPDPSAQECVMAK